ncbi:hypothetical protein EVG20_g10996 [Dentipellis fragilis]|uniref:Uncharacterized protein n=1 Tax=Dentipellis fragilis TaxID=205917 RepID=A0A4Y9XQ23_9AGAM|nr:hypothetical protein EVG20_g10996 [Dentipellis fragilis]
MEAATGEQRETWGGRGGTGARAAWWDASGRRDRDVARSNESETAKITAPTLAAQAPTIGARTPTLGMLPRQPRAPSPSCRSRRLRRAPCILSAAPASPSHPRRSQHAPSSPACPVSSASSPCRVRRTSAVPRPRRAPHIVIASSPSPTHLVGPCASLSCTVHQRRPPRITGVPRASLASPAHCWRLAARIAVAPCATLPSSAHPIDPCISPSRLAHLRRSLRVLVALGASLPSPVHHRLSLCPAHSRHAPHVLVVPRVSPSFPARPFYTPCIPVISRAPQVCPVYPQLPWRAFFATTQTETKIHMIRKQTQTQQATSSAGDPPSPGDEEASQDPITPTPGGSFGQQLSLMPSTDKGKGRAQDSPTVCSSNTSGSSYLRPAASPRGPRLARQGPRLGPFAPNTGERQPNPPPPTVSSRESQRSTSPDTSVPSPWSDSAPIPPPSSASSQPDDNEGSASDSGTQPGLEETEPSSSVSYLPAPAVDRPAANRRQRPRKQQATRVHHL